MKGELVYRDLTAAVDDSIVEGKLRMELLARQAERCFARHGFRGPQAGHVRKILVTRLDGLGDLLMTVPFLRELRYNEPEAHITLVVKPENREAVEDCPYCNQVLCFDSVPFFRCPPTRDCIQSVFDFSRRFLWQESFDHCFVPRFDIDEFYDGFICVASGARNRYGFMESVTPWKQQLNRGFNTIYTRTVPDLGFAHEVERSLSMIRYLGGTVRSSQLELWTSACDDAWAGQRLSGLTQPVAAVSMGMVADRRYWPVERYEELLKWLGMKYRMSFVLLGNQHETVPARYLAKAEHGPAMLDLTGGTTLRQMAALLRRCSLYIGRDTGTKHLAAAAGVPVVEISCHSSQVSSAAIPSPVRYGAWGVPNVVVQPQRAMSPCRQYCSRNESHCILEVSVSQVKEKVSELLNKVGIMSR